MNRIKPGNQRTEELNARMSQRNVPSEQLQSSFGIRPVSTKYASMPLIDRRELPTVPIQKRPSYNVEHIFNPGNAQAPWSGFASNINDESRLRNQFHALQRGAGQRYYIPPKTSELYNKVTLSDEVAPQQPFPLLFTPCAFEEFNPCPAGLGGNFFENFTRQEFNIAATHRNAHISVTNNLIDKFCQRFAFGMP